jgi:MFS family permease
VIDLSKNLTALLTNSAIRTVANGVISVFVVIFFYEQFGYSLKNVLILHAALYVLFIATTHLGTKLIKSLGMKNMLILGTLMLATTRLVRGVWDSDPAFFFILYVLLFVIFKMLFWVPYHTELASFTSKKKRGSELALIDNVSLALALILPIISGLLLTSFGYSTLFFLSAGITVLSVIPLFSITEREEVYEWTLPQLVSELFSKRNRPLVLGNFGNGVEDAVGSIIWPVFIFVILDGAYIQIGMVTSLVILSTIALQYLFGKLTDRYGSHKIMELGSLFQATGWIAKIFSESLIGIYLTDTYHKLGKRLNMIPFTTALYEGAEYNHHYADEYMVVREMSFMIGKALMCILAIGLINLFSVQATFLIAALATLLMIQVTKLVHIK